MNSRHHVHIWREHLPRNRFGRICYVPGLCTLSGQKHDLAPGVASLKHLERVAYIA